MHIITKTSLIILINTMPLLALDNLMSSAISVPPINKTNIQVPNSIKKIEQKTISDDIETTNININKNNKIQEYYKLRKKIKNNIKNDKFIYTQKKLLNKLGIGISLKQQQYVCVKEAKNQKDIDKCASKYLYFVNRAVIKSRSKEIRNTEFDIDKGFN